MLGHQVINPLSNLIGVGALARVRLKMTNEHLQRLDPSVPQREPGKLIKVRAKDGTEFDAFKQWHGRFASKRENALIEIEPTQFTIANETTHEK